MFRERAAITSLSALTGLTILFGGCKQSAAPVAAAQTREPLAATAPPAPPPVTGGLEGMPPLLDPNNVWAATRPGNLSPVVAKFPARVYVPNTISNTVDVIDPETFKVIDTFSVGREPQ